MVSSAAPDWQISFTDPLLRYHRFQKRLCGNCRGGMEEVKGLADSQSEPEALKSWCHCRELRSTISHRQAKVAPTNCEVQRHKVSSRKLWRHRGVSWVWLPGVWMPSPCLLVSLSPAALPAADLSRLNAGFDQDQPSGPWWTQNLCKHKN